MSQPDAVPPPTPPPAVPYGPRADAKVSATSALPTDSRSLGKTAAKWGLRILLPFVVQAIFRAIFRH